LRRARILLRRILLRALRLPWILDRRWLRREAAIWDIGWRPRRFETAELSERRPRRKDRADNDQACGNASHIGSFMAVLWFVQRRRLARAPVNLWNAAKTRIDRLQRLAGRCSAASSNH
jgi:hypothetical protein